MKRLAKQKLPALFAILALDPHMEESLQCILLGILSFGEALLKVCNLVVRGVACEPKTLSAQLHESSEISSHEQAQETQFIGSGMHMKPCGQVSASRNIRTQTPCRHLSLTSVQGRLGKGIALHAGVAVGACRGAHSLCNARSLYEKDENHQHACDIKRCLLPRGWWQGKNA